MLRLARIIAITAASGVFLGAPPLPARAAVPTSSCTSQTGNYPVQCTVYESAVGAPSELSDIVATVLPVPNDITVLVENPTLPQTDPTNWSDVVSFHSCFCGGVGSGVEIISVGCGNVNDPTDISCFPPATSVNQFVTEVPAGTGNDFTDCTSFTFTLAGPPPQVIADVNACSDSPAVETGDTVPVPEVPLPILLPIAALGLIAVVGFRKLRRRSA